MATRNTRRRVPSWAADVIVLVVVVAALAAALIVGPA